MGINGSRQRGSALLLATVVIVLIIGVGGAFLAVNNSNYKHQFSSNEADEAQAICDAAFEKVRRALYLYKRNDTWRWDSILQYCQNAPAVKAEDIPIAMKTLWTTTPFTTYLSNRAGVDTASAYEAYAPSGGNTTTTYSASPGGTIFIGQYTPFGNGVFYAKVTNNDDTAISAGGAPGSATHDTDNIVVVTIVATMRSGIQRRISASVEYVSPKSTGPKLAAIVSSTSISFNGNITVDGNDHDINGVVNHRADSFAAISGGSIGFGGASQAGGNGIAPARGGAAGVTNAANGDWTAMNSAPSGGGPTPTTFPSDPDGVMKTAPGSLKAAAIASGTYFTTQGAYNAAVSAAGGKVPGGKIIYCEFTPGPPFELGSAYNDVPSILIVHNATSDADMKNVHGNFKGLLIADSVTHINAGTQILGSVVAWGQSGNVFGNGNSDVMYSTEVLDNLPGLAPANSLLMRDYRKEVPAGSVP